MPRQPVESQEETPALGVMDQMLGEGERVNVGDGESPTGAPPPSEPPVEGHTAEGEPIRQGVVQRVVPPSQQAPRNERTSEEQAALDASQVAPKRAAPSEEDLTEIHGLPFLKVVEDCLNGLVAKHGWEAVSSEHAMSLVVNMPRLYRTIRFLHARGIYGDRKDRGQMTPGRLAELVG